MNEKKIAPCGDDCGACPRYIATRSGDKSWLEEVAVLWFELGFRDRVVSVEEIRCEGCNPSIECKHGINSCAAEKRVDNCGKCDEYPCDLMLKMFEATESHEEACLEEHVTCFPMLKEAFFEKKKNLEDR